MINRKNNIKVFLIALTALFILPNIVFAQNNTENKQKKEVFEEYAMRSIKQRAKDIAKQIEIYIKANSDKTLEDLKNDSLFQELSVQKVGKTGYTYIINHKTGILDFHPDPDIRDTSYNSFKEEFPVIWNIIDETMKPLECKDSEGFYEWRDIEDKIRDKYTYHSCINAETKDGHVFFIGASTYLDEYKENRTGKLEIGDTLQASVLENLKKSKKIFNSVEERDIKIIKGLLTDFMEDEECKKIFLGEDRDELFNHSIDLFNKNKEKYGVTHFYYHRLDGTVFLRVHNKDIFDDDVTRITFNKAKNSESWGTGIELGKTAFALRIVHPYYYQGELIGYVEFGQEIEHFIRDVKNQTRLDYGVIVKKEYIDKDKWASVRDSKKLRNNFNDIDDYVLIDSTDEEGLTINIASFDEDHFKMATEDGAIFHEFKVGSKTFIDGGFTLNDAGDNKVGVIVVIQDVSDFIAEERQEIIDNTKIYVVLAVSVFVFLVFIFLLFKYGNRIPDFLSTWTIGKKFILLFFVIILLVGILIKVGFGKLDIIADAQSEFINNISSEKVVSEEDISNFNKIILEKNNEVKSDLHVLITILFVLLVISILYMSYSITKPIKKLHAMTDEVKSGNLEAHIDIKLKDELGRLGGNLNLMTKAIADSRANVEKKVKERTKDLEKLNSSMVGRELKMIELKREIQKLKTKNK